MAGLITAHESLLALAAEHRAAITRADGAAVEDCARRQAELARAIAIQETERRHLLAKIFPARSGGVDPRTPFAALAALLPEPFRARIAACAARLRELILRLQHEHRIIRSATTAIVAHMDGLLQQVAKALSHAGLYGPKGRLDQPAHAPPAPCGLDLTL